MNFMFKRNKQKKISIGSNLILDFCVWHSPVNILFILIFSFCFKTRIPYVRRTEKLEWNHRTTFLFPTMIQKSICQQIKFWYSSRVPKHFFFKLRFQKLQPLLHTFLKHWINYVNQMQINNSIKVQYSSHELFF